MKSPGLLSLSLLLLTLTTCSVFVNAGMYTEQVVELTPQNFDKLVINSAETWLVKFYAPWCGHCQSSAPAFSKAAKRLRGVAKLGVVNCDDHKDIARRFGIQGFPSIKVFKGEGSKARRPSDYNSARSSKAFIDHIKYVMPSFVAHVKPSGVDAFFNDLPKLPHVLLFTEQSTTSPLYKGMSAKFRNILALGEIKKSEVAQSVISQYDIQSFPSLIAFPPGKNDIESAIPFKGSLDPESLDRFFNTLSSGNTTDLNSEEFNTQSEKKQEEKVFSQPKAYSGEINDVVGKKNYEELCGARKDGRMCVISFISGGLSDEKNEILKPIAQKYIYDNMAFAVMNIEIDEAKAYAQLFGLSENTNGVVVIRGRKNKFTVMESDQLSKDNVVSFLDKIVGGDARWKKISGDLPEWEVEESEEENSEESNEQSNSQNEGQCGKPPGGEGGEGSCGAGGHEEL